MRRPGNSKNGLSAAEPEGVDQNSGNSGSKPGWLPDAAGANAVLEGRSRARRSQEPAEVTTDPLQFLRTREVCRLLGISKPTLWRLRRANAFPEPTELTDRVIGWRRSEVEEWLLTRNKGRGRGASNRTPVPTGRNRTNARPGRGAVKRGAVESAQLILSLKARN